MPWSTSSIPALQNVPEISKRSSSYLREKRRQLRPSAVEGSTRTAPNFVSMAFGDVRGADRRSSGDARCDVVFLDIAAEDLDRGGRAARLAEAQHILAPDAAHMTPDRIARLQLRTPGWSARRRAAADDLDPVGVRAPGAAAARADDLHDDQRERRKRCPIGDDAGERRVQFVGEHADEARMRRQGRWPAGPSLQRATQNRMHAVPPDDRFAKRLTGTRLRPGFKPGGNAAILGGKVNERLGKGRSGRRMRLIHRI